MNHCLPLLRRLALLAIALYCAGCVTAPSGGKQDRAALAAQPLREARHKTSAEAVPLYLDAAQKGLALATDKTAPAAQQAAGLATYDTAVAKCAVALQKQELMPAEGRTLIIHGPGGAYALRVTGDVKAGPSYFDRFVESSSISRKHLKANVERAGLGGTLTGVINNPKTASVNRPPGGFAEPVTDVATFGKTSRAGVTPVKLAFYDPREKTDVSVDGATFPLRADFTAPLAYFPHPNELIFGIVGMLRSDRIATRTAIYFLQPYDPEKIPVLFVHGLMSSPHAWINFVNNLDSDPEFRKHYQPWVFFYPSGAPIAANAYRLRRSLADIAAHYPLKRNIVVVGHSMGGILTQMQITNSGRVLWDTVFGGMADTVYAEFPGDSLLKKALIFRANPYIARVIFISTPHLGSNLASLRISAFAGALIRMPSDLVHAFDPKTRAALSIIHPGMRNLPSSIIGLSPHSPLLVGVSKLPITVPYHSIIGNQGHDKVPLEKSSDSVVPYWSSHMAGAQSEIIVPTGHDAFNCPQSVTEVLRILALQRE